MVVLVGAVEAGVVLVGALLTLDDGAGATGSVLVVPLGDADDAPLVLVTDAGVVDVELGVEPPPSLVSSTIPKITNASRAATSTPNAIRAAGLRCHGVDPASDSLGC